MSSIQSNSTPAPSASPAAPPRRQPRMRSALVSGGGGIRTLVRGLTPETVFETAAFNHSATPPKEATSSRSRVAKRTGRPRPCGSPTSVASTSWATASTATSSRTAPWGWSNAGLIAADGTSLLVDTLFDLELTRAMLDAMRPVTDRSPIDAAMNTHGNGDHCFGNELLPDSTEIYATAKA